MKFFIDTANLDQIREAQDLGILDGVTTNPSLMAKEGISGKEAILQHYKDICEIVDGDISAEVLSTTYEEMIKEGEELAAIHPNIVVKVHHQRRNQSHQIFFPKRNPYQLYPDFLGRTSTFSGKSRSNLRFSILRKTGRCFHRRSSFNPGNQDHFR